MRFSCSEMGRGPIQSWPCFLPSHLPGGLSHPANRLD
jgi:hypothetical protein